MKEIWKDIEGYDGDYQVSNLGRVKSLKFNKERILNPCFNGGKYYYICLCKNNKQKSFRVHRLIGLTFIPNPDNKSEINHKDGNKSNNNINNLEWCTQKENISHAIKTGLIDNKGEKHYRSKLTELEILEIRKLYKTGKYSQRELGKKFNVHQRNIWGIVNKEKWKHI